MRVCGSFWLMRSGAVQLTAVLASALLASAAGAVSFTIDEFVGRDAEVTFELEQVGDDIRLTAEVTEGRGHLRAIYFDLAAGFDASQLDITLEGSDGLGSVDTSGNVISVGGATNLRGGRERVTFDVGVGIGSQGRSDDFDSIVLIISSETLDLDLSMFSEQLFGSRLAAPSGKLRGEAPFIVPEPATATLVVLGLGGLGIAGRRRPRA